MVHSQINQLPQMGKHFEAGTGFFLCLAFHAAIRCHVQIQAENWRLSRSHESEIQRIQSESSGSYRWAEDSFALSKTSSMDRAAVLASNFDSDVFRPAAAMLAFSSGSILS